MAENINRVIDWIKGRRQENTSWEELAAKPEPFFLDFMNKNLSWPILSPEQYLEILNTVQADEEEATRLQDDTGATVRNHNYELNDITIPDWSNSAWQCYKAKLRNKGFSRLSIDNIEKATLDILRNLSRDTTTSGPVKGLIVGNVQSGKTANMAALMALAADWGWNMFIILSGITNNLRDQLIKRLQEDLHSNDCDLNWNHIDNPSEVPRFSNKTRYLHLEENRSERYFSVSLKNGKRLRNLFSWLQYYPERKNLMKVLVIDDEADQASINTSEEERTTINRLIVNFVHNKNSDGEPKGSFKAMNYLGYTATPYANVLNESGEESLYPRNLIKTLAVSDEYFGPQQIFGCESTKFDGLDIVRIINDNDIEQIDAIHKGDGIALPESLKDAICWFICSVAAMRYSKHNGPLSMLVHTSMRKDNHFAFADAIKRWMVPQNTINIIERCTKIWNDERNRFTPDIFHSQYPDYRSNSVSGQFKVDPLPDFDTIRPQLITVLESGLQRIDIDSETTISYGNGIHLCVDNSDKRVNDDETMSRLIYPTKDNMPDLAPAFLIIGGNTLSRGLTLEGLMCSFFRRPTHAADTLMQMGRWFGYRRNCELLPRIWMPQTTKDQFVYLADLDQQLRDEIADMGKLGKTPQDCAIKILNSPLVSITNPHKMQGAVTASVDMSGHTIATSMFENDIKTLQSNLEATDSFICSLGNPTPNDPSNNSARNSTIWRDVPFATIKDFLLKYIPCSRQKVFSDINPTIEWFEQQQWMTNWNVILVGINNADESRRITFSNGISTIKTNRTRSEQRADNIINIKTISSPNDYLADIILDDIQDPFLRASVSTNKDHTRRAIAELRRAAGLESTPQLLIYIVDKDSKPKKNSGRYPLEAKADIAGIAINIPGEYSGRNTVTSVQIALPETEFEDPEQ